jgi:hypothetical protein
MKELPDLAGQGASVAASALITRFLVRLRWAPLSAEIRRRARFPRQSH